MTTVHARDASTVVLVRDAADGLPGLEVLLLERHADSRFAPGAFAFPGGRVEADDAWPDADRLCRGLTTTEAAGALRDVQPADRAIGFWIAALREVFEETGLLLAHGPSGAPFSPDPAARLRLVAHRARCRRDGATFRTMLIEEELTLATDRMVYYAHWITPDERPIRYDTRFFVAAAFPGEMPDPDGVEMVGWRWLAPAEALAQHRAAEITLPFPTQETLRSFAGHDDVAGLLGAARHREIRPLQPRVVRTDAGERILMPGDPGYF